MGPEVHVSALALGRLAFDVERLRPTHVLSLVDPETTFDVDLRGARHRLLRFADTLDPDDPHAITPALLEEALAFARGALAEAALRPVRLVVHCHMGQSRSPAFAYVTHALHLGPGREAEAFQRMRSSTPGCWPNALLIELADEHLGRGGALLAPYTAFREKHRLPSRARSLRRGDESSA